MHPCLQGVGGWGGAGGYFTGPVYAALLSASLLCEAVLCGCKSNVCTLQGMHSAALSGYMACRAAYWKAAVRIAQLSPRSWFDSVTVHPTSCGPGLSVKQPSDMTMSYNSHPVITPDHAPPPCAQNQDPQGL